MTIERAGSVSHTVQIYEEIAKRHVDQILSRKDSGKSKKVNKDNYIDFSEYYMISPSSNQVSSEATNDSPPCHTPSTNSANAKEPSYPTLR